MSEFHFRVFCKCGWNRRVPVDDLFHVHQSICPDCGNKKPQWDSHSPYWTIKTVKWVSHSVWNKPFTWGTGEWIEAKDLEEKQS